MRIHLSALIATVVLNIASGITASAQDIATGKEIFMQTCGACHTVGRGRLVGPDLMNINQKKPEDWIVNFIKSSQTVIKSGDKYADSLYIAFNKTLMPDHPNLTDGQIKDMIAYIGSKSTASSATSSNATEKTTNENTAKPAGTLFTTTNILLFGAMFVMLLVIWSLARINKNLLEQIKDYYSSNSSFF